MRQGACVPGCSRTRSRFNVLCGVVLAALTVAQANSQQPAPADRWDGRLINSAHVWSYMDSVVHCPSAAEWIALKENIAQVIAANPEDEYTPSLALASAYGTATHENDAARAIAELNEVIAAYAERPTVMTELASLPLVAFDYVWDRFRSGRVLLNPDRSLRRGRPFGGEDGELSFREKAALQYFEHLDTYPRLTGDVAQLTVALLPLREGDYETACRELEEFIAGRQPRMLEMDRADRAAVDSRVGYAVHGVRRPVAAAYRYLSQAYRDWGRMDEAIRVAEELVGAISADGFHWQQNEFLGQLYTEAGGMSSSAEAQYRSALQGYLSFVRNEMNYKIDEYGQIHEIWIEEWEDVTIRLKTQVHDAGGSVTLDAAEVEEIRAQLGARMWGEPPEDETPLDRLRRLLKAANRAEGEFALAENRSAALLEIRDAVLGQCARTDADFDAKLERASFAAEFAHFAEHESDPRALEDALQSMMDLVRVQGISSRDDLPGDSLRQAVDWLIMQMSGEDVSEHTVPRPTSQLSAMPGSALLYASQRMRQGDLPMEVRRTMILAMAGTANPVLYDFFVTLIREGEDEVLVRLAAFGLDRIIKKADFDENGVIHVTHD